MVLLQRLYRLIWTEATTMRSLSRLAACCTSHRPPSTTTGALGATATRLTFHNTNAGFPVRCEPGLAGLCVPPSAFLPVAAGLSASSKQQRSTFAWVQNRGYTGHENVLSVGCHSVSTHWRDDLARQTFCMRYSTDRNQAPRAAESEDQPQG